MFRETEHIGSALLFDVIIDRFAIRCVNSMKLLPAAEGCDPLLTELVAAAN